MKFIKVILLLLLAALVSAGCTQTQPTDRSLSRHLSGEFSAVNEIGQEGMYFWKCKHSAEGVRCRRICGYAAHHDRICAPEIHYEFGEVSGPRTQEVRR